MVFLCMERLEKKGLNQTNPSFHIEVLMLATRQSTKGHEDAQNPQTPDGIQGTGVSPEEGINVRVAAASLEVLRWYENIV